MKLPAHTFRVEWELHAWAGVIISLWIFVVFYCGIFSLFRKELAVWQEPRLYVEADTPPSFERTRQVLLGKGLLEASGYVSMVPYAGTRYVATYVKTGGVTQLIWVDPVTGDAVPESSRLAHELYHLHHVQQVPGGETTTGIVAVFLLVALLTGVVIHLKDLPAQLVRMRLTMKPRFAMSDVHKVFGIFGLPFTTLIAWSGAVLVLGGTYGKVFSSILGDEPKLAALMGETKQSRPRTGELATSLDLDTLVTKARATLGDVGTPTYLQYYNATDSSAFLRLTFAGLPFTGDRVAFVQATTGEATAAGTSPYAQVASGLHDFHYGRYGGLGVRAVHGLLALMGLIVIVTGNIVWVTRRDPQRTRLVHRLVEASTIGVCCGLVAASAVYCLANRLGMTHDLRIFYATWAACVIVVLAARPKPRPAIAALLGGAGIVFLVVLGHDLASAPRLHAVVVADWLFASLGACSLGSAAGSLWGFQRL